MNTEIYGTLGPSCCTQEIIEKLIQEGMTGMRLNLSHCNLTERKDWIDAFHKACHKMNQTIDLMIDMRGPELRLKEFDAFELFSQNELVLDDAILPRQIIDHADINDLLLIDDGKIQLQVIQKNNSSLLGKVLCPGVLKPRKSIALNGKSISGPVLTESDLLNLSCAKEYGVTSIMQPFVKSKEDLIQLKQKLNERKLEDLKIYAKIENMQGVEHLEDLLPYCDVIVIARGDLANACTLEKLPCIQKEIETICRKHKKPYMVVTEMLHSMIHHPVATRAEVSDIFHAVYHGASAIMLTAETASGKYPVQAMHTFKQTAEYAFEYRKEENAND